jgi:superoxide reductase
MADGRGNIYKCGVCGNIVEMLSAGSGTMVCCGQDMELMRERVEDQGNEKHVPVIEKSDKGYRIKVGSVQHPMEDKHYIMWIELVADGKSYRQFLKPGMKPEAEFCVDASSVSAREYCNLHGLWKSR